MTAAVISALLIMLGLIAAVTALAVHHHSPHPHYRHRIHRPHPYTDRLRHLIATRRPR